ncbi:MAG: HIT family protein [Flavobacterium sp.]|nr:HIT family protein [Flavobacterium sp.]
MSTIFSKIISGELSCYKIAEDADFMAFLDVNPNAEGHTLCIPKKEVNKIFDLDDDLYLKLMRFSKKIAVALEKTVDCKRIGMAVIGLEVPHAHVHLIPINEMNDMRFQNKVTLTKEQFEELAEKIKNNLN